MIGLLILLSLFIPLPAYADSLVVQTCGTLPQAYAAGGTRLDTVDVNGNKCTTTSAAPAATDPCASGTKSFQPISQATSTQVITGTASKKTYICSYAWNGADAENISLVEGTGSVCATNTFALVGGTTAATGNNFQAGSGIAQGNGQGVVAFGSADTNATAANVCLLQSGTGRVAGVIGYVQQ